MGYYTWYTLDIIKDPDNQVEDFYEEFDEKTGLLFDFSNYNGTEAKWYNWESDMKELSKKFPKMMFRLDGTGEAQFDVWDCHFCNGRSYYREIQTYWEPFDELGFYISNKG
jgi:hypothetical protein